MIVTEKVDINIEHLFRHTVDKYYAKRTNFNFGEVSPLEEDIWILFKDTKLHTLEHEWSLVKSNYQELFYKDYPNYIWGDEVEMFYLTEHTKILEEDERCRIGFKWIVLNNTSTKPKNKRISKIIRDIPTVPRVSNNQNDDIVESVNTPKIKVKGTIYTGSDGEQPLDEFVLDLMYDIVDSIDKPINSKEVKQEANRIVSILNKEGCIDFDN